MIYLITVVYVILFVLILSTKTRFYSRSAKEVNLKLLREEQESKKLEVTLTTKNPNMKPILLPVYFEHYPLRGLVKERKFVPLGALPNTYTFINSEGSGLPAYKSDRFGFRNNDIVWDELKELDLVVIGDSFIGGHGLLKDTINDNLNDRGIRTLNLGLGGYSACIIAFNKIFLPAIKPKNVLVVFYGTITISLKKSTVII